MSDDLPVGWVKTNLSTIVEWGSGGTPSRGNSQYYGGDIPWLKTGELGPQFITSTQETISEDGLANSSAKIFPKGSVVLAMYGATIGKTSILGIDASTNQACAVGITNPEITTVKYIYYYLCHQKEAFIEAGKGGAQPNISQKVIKAWEIPLPPLNEQKRIAEKLEQLLTAVDATKNRLDKVPTILKRFRQSVLAAAVSGELTKDWREGRDLKCTATQINIEKKLLPTSFELPPEWQWNVLGNLIEGIESGKNIKCEERSPVENEFGIVKISAVTWGFFNENESKTLNDKKLFLENRRIQEGDLLISRANTLELLGAPVIVDRITKNLMLSDKVLRLLSVNGYKEWLNICLRSPLGRHQIELLATGNQLSMRNIAQKNLKRVHIPTPSKEEIVEIVNRVDALFSLANTFEAKLGSSAQKIERLTASILTKAFKGELVPQDPNDEPAQLLLENITQAKREKKISKPVRRRKKVMPTKAKKGASLSITAILQDAEQPISAQQLLALYAPGSPEADEVEDFFVSLRDCLSKNVIMRERRNDEDWFTLATGAGAS